MIKCCNCEKEFETENDLSLICEKQELINGFWQATGALWRLMRIECEVTRLIHKNNDFQLVACIPIGEYENLAIHPRFHTITIKDPTNRLVLNKTSISNFAKISKEQEFIKEIPDDSTLYAKQ